MAVTVIAPGARGGRRTLRARPASAGTVEGGTDGTPAAGAEVSDLVVERSPS